MLLSYSMKGFRSVDNEVVVDLKSTNYKILGKTNVSQTGILKGALFVGKNGAGKSTMLSSIKLLLDLLFSKDELNLLSYFCLTSKKEKKIELNYTFFVRRSTVSYNITIEYGKTLLIHENLYINKELIIDRKGSSGVFENGATPIHATEIESNRLFLRDLIDANYINGNKVLFELINYLQNSVYINSTENRIVCYNSSVNNKLNQDLVGQVNQMNELFHEFNMDYRISIHSDNGKPGLRVQNTYDKIALPISIQSSGLKLFVKILPHYIHCIENGGIFLIDEPSFMHPECEKAFISYFEQNTAFGQLLIATSSTTMLGANVLRADQLYNVKKNGNGTDIFRFSVKQPRELQNMEKMYFNNTFNGI